MCQNVKVVVSFELDLTCHPNIATVVNTYISISRLVRMRCIRRCATKISFQSHAVCISFNISFRPCIFEIVFCCCYCIVLSFSSCSILLSLTVSIFRFACSCCLLFVSCHLIKIRVVCLRLDEPLHRLLLFFFFHFGLKICISRIRNEVEVINWSSFAIQTPLFHPLKHTHTISCVFYWLFVYLFTLLLHPLISFSFSVLVVHGSLNRFLCVSVRQSQVLKNAYSRNSRKDKNG